MRNLFVSGIFTKVSKFFLCIVDLGCEGRQMKDENDRVALAEKVLIHLKSGFPRHYHLLKYLSYIIILYILLYGEFRTLTVIMETLTLMC